MNTRFQRSDADFEPHEVEFAESGETHEVLIASNQFGGRSFGAGVQPITVEGAPVLAVITVAGGETGLGDRVAALRWLCLRGLPPELAVDLVDFAIRTYHATGTN